MCGINGFSWPDGRLIKEVNKAIKHRGPDDEGEFVDENISLAQVRLSIIDLSPAGHNPMFYDKVHGAFSERHQPGLMKNAEVGIVFNGEIYNFLDVKEDLKKKGYVFSTKCDTEVILASYFEWGFDCVKHLNGMWAFCIYDKRKGIMFLSRDRLGVKPLYYYLKDGRLAFSSLVKGIVAHKELRINRAENVLPEAVQFYFSLGYIPSPYSIYKDVYKLEARQNLVFDISKGKVRKKWYYYDIPAYSPVYDRRKLIEEGRRILDDSTRIRMIADVPVGAFLSGGLDSSTVVGVMKNYTDLKKLHTFSIGFEGEYDESRYIHIVRNYFRTRHHHYYFKKKDFEKLISRYSDIYDEPFGDYSGFPTYKVSELARKYVTVALSGDGGDEIFGGYSTHKLGYQMDLIYKMPRIMRLIGSRIPARKNLNGFVSLYLLREACKISLRDKKYFYAESLAEDGIKPLVYKKWTAEKLHYALGKGKGSLAEGLRIYDLMFNTLQDNFLVKVDRASMMHPLEVRSPFLDYRFIEYAQHIPTEWKQDYRKTKILMREIIKDILPKEIVNRGKWGFTPPLDKWILEEKYSKRLLKHCERLKGIDPQIYDFYKSKVFLHDNKLYTLYKIKLFLFGLWWDRWIKE